MVQRFGYAQAAIFIAEGDALELGAQRGYAEDMAVFDPRTGVVGRAATDGGGPARAGRRARPGLRARRPAGGERDRGAHGPRRRAAWRAEHRVHGAHPLDRIDRDLVATMADKLATALALARDRQALTDLAVRDGLTGLHNRRFFDEAVARLLSARDAMPPSERRSVAAILFDLDHFGTFNKLHGVQVGDQALRVFAHAMRERLASDRSRRPLRRRGVRRRHRWRRPRRCRHPGRGDPAPPRSSGRSPPRTGRRCA